MATKPAVKLIAGALFLCAAAAAPITPAATNRATAPPNLTGLWARGAVRGEVTFLPVPGDKEGQPIEREWIDGPDVEEIVAAKYENPILQPRAREIGKKNHDGDIELQHVNEGDDICRPVGIPQIINLREPVEFAQGKDRVLIIYQRDHLARHVWLNKQHSAKVTPSWFGESVGHYEGDTFVVDTIGL